MRKTMKSNWAILAMAFLIGGLAGYVIQEGASQITKEPATTDFLKDYVVAILDIEAGRHHQASEGWLFLEGQHAQPPSPSEMIPSEVFENARHEFRASEEFLERAKTKLEKLNGKAPDPFFEIDLKNRLEQVRAHQTLNQDYLSLIDSAQHELKAVKLENSHARLYYHALHQYQLKKLAQDLKKQSEADHQIDMHWDQNWYPRPEENTS